MKYNETITALVNSLAKYFDNVYHSAETINVDGKKFPAIISGDEWIELEPTDQRQIIYVRRNGDDTVVEQKKLGSCSVAYTMHTPLRIVFFEDHISNHEEIITKMMRASLVSFTKLRSITRDKFKLLKEESDIDYKLGASTAYMAIDIHAIWHLISDNCGDDFCVVIENPVRQCS